MKYKIISKAARVLTAPRTLTILSIAGSVISVGLASKATIKAVRIYDEEKQAVLDNADNQQKAYAYIDSTQFKKQVAKRILPKYIATGVTLITSAGLAVLAHKQHLKKEQALLLAYKVGETAFIKYRESAKEYIPEDKEKKIYEESKPTQVERKEIQTIITNDDKIEFMDALSGRTFITTYNKLESVRNKVNAELFADMQVPLNTFYDNLDLAYIDLGNNIGWDINHDRTGIDLEYSPAMIQGRPVVEVSINPKPYSLYN